MDPAQTVPDQPVGPEPPADPIPDRSRALAQPGFVRLWAGQSVSELGFQFEGLAMPVLAVTMLHATERQMGYLNAANTAAFLLVGLAAGAWVDRWRKRRVMLVADVLRMALVLVVPLLWFAGHLAFWQLYLVAALVGVATVFFDVAYQSFVPVLVPDEAVGDANGKLESTAQLTRLAGPALAGVLLRLVAAPVLLLVNAASFAVSALALATIRDGEQPQPRPSDSTLVREIREGVAFVAGQPLLRRIVATTMLSNLGATMMMTLEPLLVLRLLGLDAWFFGVVMSLGSIGGLLGSLAANRMVARWGEGPTVRAVLLVCVVGDVMLPLSPLVPRAAAPVLLVGSALVVSFTAISYNIVQVTARQRLCPPHLLGRMNASIRFVVWGVMPLSALAAGWLGAAVGTVPTLWLGAAITVLGVLPFLGHYGRMREFPRPTQSGPGMQPR